MLVKGRTSLGVCIGREASAVKCVKCPDLACDAILGVDSLRYAEAVLNFAEDTFSPTGAMKPTQMVRYREKTQMASAERLLKLQPYTRTT
uniref:Transposase n=1 Tax=Echinococcus granulosus TaxID=6210 RepID=A0A068X130_ECHGR|nr:hypothetical protein EgrG_002043900 [Echinococcus granulosus]